MKFYKKSNGGGEGNRTPVPKQIELWLYMLRRCW